LVARSVGRRSVWLGALLWAVLWIPAVVESAAVDDVALRWAELVAGGLVVGAAVLLRRAHLVAALCVPVVAATVSALVLAPSATAPGRLWPFVASAAFGYLAGLRIGSVRPVWYALCAIVLAGLPVSVAVDGATRGGFGLLFGLYDWLVLVLILLGAVVFPWFVGRYRRQRAELVSAGWERADLLERQQRLEVERVRLAERARIARDMHDSLGHEWGLIALRAAALQVSADADDRVRASAGELRASVATATERLREVIGVLRPDGSPASAEPADLAGLIERAADAGLAVRVDQRGDPVALPAMGHRAVHRVVQEALTNATKHAPGAEVTVDIEHGSADTTVTVANGPAIRPRTDTAGGYGLVGLRERVRLLGGTLRAEPRADGGFTLAVGLPHAPSPVAPVEPEQAPTIDVDPPGHLDRARGRARRDLAAAIGVPLVAGAAVALSALTLSFLVGTDNRLDPAVYDRFALGEPRAAVEPELPPFQVLGDLENAYSLPAPPTGAVCRYYWSDVQTDDRLFFRLCFDSDRLVDKDAIGRAASERG
jgi:signal transduction histidine kinase